MYETSLVPAVVRRRDDHALAVAVVDDVNGIAGRSCSRSIPEPTAAAVARLDLEEVEWARRRCAACRRGPRSRVLEDVRREAADVRVIASAPGRGRSGRSGRGSRWRGRKPTSGLKLSPTGGVAACRSTSRVVVVVEQRGRNSRCPSGRRVSVRADERRTACRSRLNLQRRVDAVGAVPARCRRRRRSSRRGSRRWRRSSSGRPRAARAAR